MLTPPLTQIIDQFRMADHTLGAQDLLFEPLDSSFFKLVVGERKVHETGGFFNGSRLGVPHVSSHFIDQSCYMDTSNSKKD